MRGQNTSKEELKLQKSSFSMDFRDELKRKNIAFKDDKDKKKKVAKLQKWAKDNDYVLVQEKEDVLKIWGPAVSAHLERMENGEVYFYVWKYSGYLNLIEKEEDVEYFNLLTDEQKRKVAEQIKIKRLLENNYVVVYWGDKKYLEISKNGTIASRIKQKKKNDKGEMVETGEYKPLWIMPHGDSGRAHVKRILLGIDQLPASLIKEILK